MAAKSLIVLVLSMTVLTTAFAGQMNLDLFGDNKEFVITDPQFYVDNDLFEDHTEETSNCPRKMVAVLDPECRETIEICTNNNGGRLDCREICKSASKTVRVPAVFSTCGESCGNALRECVDSHCPFKRVNECQKPYNTIINLRSTPACASTVNFLKLDLCKDLLECEADADVKVCADRLLKTHPECMYTLVNHCTDIVTIHREKPKATQCRPVLRHACKEDAVDRCQRIHPQCFNDKCGIKMLEQVVQAKDCLQVCPSGIKCQKTPNPVCYKAIRKNVC